MTASASNPAAKFIKPRPMMLGVLVSYVGIYLLLTSLGSYIPGTWGLRGVKNWLWAPALFADKKGAFRDPIQFAFLPAWLLDRWFWHNDRTGESGPRHPAFTDQQ